MNDKLLDTKLEIELLELEIHEKRLSVKKYEKKVQKEKEKLTTKYSSPEEVEEAFEFSELSMDERDVLLDYFENLSKSINEMFLNYLKRDLKNTNLTLKYFRKELFNEELVKLARSEEAK